MSQTKIAVIGAGSWGKNLVRNFSEIGVLEAVCDANREQLESLKNEFSVKNAYADLNDVMNSADINAVAIASPAAMHYEMVEAALNAGKDVFVEKPLALHVNEAEKLIQLAKQKEKILMVDHILRYHPAVIKLKELIDAGELGKLQYIYSNRLNIGKLRTEENILWSFAPHDISVILHLAGEAPQSVEAVGEAYLQENIFDMTMTHLSFTNKLRAHVFVSWLHPYKEQKFVVIGDKNMAVFNDVEEKDKLIVYPHKVEWIKREPIASKASGEVIPIDLKEPLREVCLHFLDCVKTRSVPRTDGGEALAVLDVLEKAQEKLDKLSRQP